MLEDDETNEPSKTHKFTTTHTFWEQIFTNNKESNTKTIQEVTRSVQQVSILPRQTSVQINIQSLQNYLWHLPAKKAPRKDGIPNAALRRLNGLPLHRLLQILNCALYFQKIPHSWKNAVIVPIPKANKDPRELNNARPMSLLNGISKILETIIKEHLGKFVENHKILPPCQYGFRSATSAIQQAANLTHHLESARAPRLFIAVALLDIEKAYDKVWREGLTHKLFKHNFSR